ncbi:hypothetical protein MZM54_04930 [[Brevibacterium] frigoritolerans]|nr:hypothetical protein [Peribacillus frigoritolerans]
MEKNCAWGLFLNNTLMAEYKPTLEGYEEALKDAKFVLQETGIPHEVKHFECNKAIA